MSALRQKCLTVCAVAVCGALVSWGETEVSLALPGEPKLQIYSALESRALELTPVMAEGTLSHWRTPSGTQVLVETRTGAEGPQCVVKLHESGSELARYRVSIRAALSGAGPWRVWNGHDEKVLAGDGRVSRERFTDTFPLATAENGQVGYAIGLAPTCEIADFSSLHVCRGERLGIQVTAKTVVDAAHPQTLVFTLGAFDPEFGWAQALEDYYAHYPSYFRPQPNVDERLYGVGGYLGLYNGCEGFEWHPRRYDRISWEWSYAPWVHSGDWYPEKGGMSDGDYETATDRFGNLPRGSDGKVSWETYNRVLKEHFASANRRVGMFYYVYVNDVHTNIVFKHPEALMRGPDGKTGTGGSSSNPNDRGHTRYCTPHGTSLAPFLERKMRLAAENYEISGYSFDMANNSGFTYAPAVVAAGRFRTFDEQGRVRVGIFADPVHFGEYAHTLSRDGRRMGVVMNFALMGVTPAAAFTADAALFEGTPADNLDQVLIERILMGQKPLSFWGDPTNHGSYSPLDWPTVRSSPERLKEATAGLAELLAFLSLRYGIAMQSWSAWHEKVRPYLNVILEIQRLGWHPVTAVKDSSAKLWIGRFGKGAETVLTVTNPEREAVTAELTLVSSHLGDTGNGLLLENAPVPVRKAGGRLSWTVTLPPKAVRVYRFKPVRGVFDQTEDLSVAAASRTLVFGDATTKRNRGIAKAFDCYGAFRQRNPELLTKFPAHDAFSYAGLPKGPFYQCQSGTDKAADQWRIAIGTPDELPTLRPLLSVEARAALTAGRPVLARLEPQQIIWVTGLIDAVVDKALDAFFNSLDQFSAATQTFGGGGTAETQRASQTFGGESRCLGGALAADERRASPALTAETQSVFTYIVER